MRTYRTSRGPFRDRPHYKLTEIDRICSEALKATGLMPSSPERVRIDRFVEKHFKVVPRYERLPEGVLGYTAFGKNGVASIVVSTSLDEEGGQVAERRIRTTLAHEGGHGLLHMHLFALGEKPGSVMSDFGHHPQANARPFPRMVRLD